VCIQVPCVCLLYAASTVTIRNTLCVSNLKQHSVMIAYNSLFLAPDMFQVKCRLTFHHPLPTPVDHLLNLFRERKKTETAPGWNYRLRKDLHSLLFSISHQAGILHKWIQSKFCCWLRKVLRRFLGGHGWGPKTIQYLRVTSSSTLNCNALNIYIYFYRKQSKMWNLFSFFVHQLL
jgi:hypothetical protein